MIDINNSSSEKTKAVFEEFLSSCILQGNEVGEYIQFAYLPEERSKRLADVLLYAPFVKAEKSGYKGKYDFFSMHDSAALLKAYNDMKDNDVVIAKYTSDFLGALRLYIQFVASVSLIQNKSKELLSNNLQFFRDFLINCCVSERGKGEFFKVGAQTNYTNKAKRDTLYDYDITLPESKKVDIYTCNDALYPQTLRKDGTIDIDKELKKAKNVYLLFTIEKAEDVFSNCIWEMETIKKHQGRQNAHPHCLSLTDLMLLREK